MAASKTAQQPATPSYRRQRQKGRPDRAFVLIDGQRHYLGRYDSPESRAAYDRLIAEWLANGRALPSAPDEITVVEVVAAYRRSHTWPKHDNYRIRHALKLLDSLYGDTLAAEFGPKRLKALRQTWIEQGRRPTTIRCYVGIVKRVFRWAVAEEMIPASVIHALEALPPLRADQCKKQTRDREPVPQGDIHRTWPQLTRPVRGLVLLLKLTAARPSELLRLRATDLDMGEEVWTYKPSDHKTRGKGKDRTIYFGPRGQKVLRYFMRPSRDIRKPLFSPRESNAEAKRRGATGTRREDQKPNPISTERTIRDAFDSANFRRAIDRSCRAAGVPVWTPYQLRHTAATMIRAKYGWWHPRKRASSQ